MSGDWLTIRRGTAPLVVSFPHTGTIIPPQIEDGLVSPWLARKDTDWWVVRLYQLAGMGDATLVHTAISRTVIDVNRDPLERSLYPGQATTELCPTTTFDGEPLYRDGQGPDWEEKKRRLRWFVHYHLALANELKRLRRLHGRVVLYDAHSIRSRIPRLFRGWLPHFNIGTNNGASCAPELTTAVEAVCDSTSFRRVTNGRFVGGYITRLYGKPDQGVHAIQMELACRGYVREPRGSVNEKNWPPQFDTGHARSMAEALHRVLGACLEFATST
jgi:N-formylglutamate deformylase